jgi:hypothetical protein
MVLLNKYKQNLEVDYQFVYSYKTKVGKFDHVNKQIIVDEWWSSTTSKHINYVANEYDYEVVKKYE